MPVRKIPRNYRNVTGLLATDKAEGMTGYESRLEHDCQKLVNFNLNVQRYEEQPVKIFYSTPDGKRHHYTPDILITFRTDVYPANRWRPLLAEIKYRSELATKWPTIKPKLQAGRQHAKEVGWDFTIITDGEIYTPLLKSAIFLLEYRKYPINEADSELLLSTLEIAGEADPSILLNMLTDSSVRRAELLPTLWQLISTHQIWINLDEPIKMCSRIRPAYSTKEISNDNLFHPRAGRARNLRWQALRYHPHSYS